MRCAGSVNAHVGQRVDLRSAQRQMNHALIHARHGFDGHENHLALPQMPCAHDHVRQFAGQRFDHEFVDVADLMAVCLDPVAPAHDNLAGGATSRTCVIEPGSIGGAGHKIWLPTGDLNVA